MRPHARQVLTDDQITLLTERRAALFAEGGAQRQTLLIQPLLPNKPREVPRADDRRVVEWSIALD